MISHIEIKQTSSGQPVARYLEPGVLRLVFPGDFVSGRYLLPPRT